MMRLRAIIGNTSKKTCLLDPMPTFVSSTVLRASQEFLGTRGHGHLLLGNKGTKGK